MLFSFFKAEFDSAFFLPKTCYKALIFCWIIPFFGATLSLAQPRTLEEMRAVKITNVDSQILFTDAAIEHAMNKLADMGINAVLPVVWNAATTQYPSEVMNRYFQLPIDPRMQGRDPLRRIIIEAHKHGMEVYPWFEYGFAAWYSGQNTSTKGGPLLEKYPDWALRDQDGSITTKNGFAWMNGIHPEVQEFMTSLVLEVVDNYDVDGVEFSDRIPALPVEGGYDPVTIEMYQSEHGGASPPSDYRNTSWKKWRATKLSEWYEQLKDSVKSRDSHLIVASSPSVYPWGYDEYLQDNLDWMEYDVIDHYIPQLYRYTINEYDFELSRSLSQIQPEKRDRLFAGILLNVGSYKAGPTYVREMLQSNRTHGLLGEAFFFYEGFFKDGEEIATLLKEEFYSEPAMVPLRNGFEYRPKATIAQPISHLSHDWETFGTFDGYEVALSHSSPTSLSISLSPLIEAWYDIYLYGSNDRRLADSVSVRFAEDLTENLPFRQKEEGYQFWKTIWIEDSIEIELTNTGQEGALATLPIMAILNRNLSPNARISTSLLREKPPIPSSIGLEAYPNPFNPSTTITFTLPVRSKVTLDLYSVTGKKIQSLLKGERASGVHSEILNLNHVASGMYLLHLETEIGSTMIKLLLLK